MRETILGAEARLVGRAHITWGLKGLVKCLSLSPLSCGKLIKGRKKIPFSPSFVGVVCKLYICERFTGTLKHTEDGSCSDKICTARRTADGTFGT